MLRIAPFQALEKYFFSFPILFSSSESTAYVVLCCDCFQRISPIFLLESFDVCAFVYTTRLPVVLPMCLLAYGSAVARHVTQTPLRSMGFRAVCTGSLWSIHR